MFLLQDLQVIQDQQNDADQDIQVNQAAQQADEDANHRNGSQQADQNAGNSANHQVNDDLDHQSGYVSSAEGLGKILLREIHM